MLHDVRYGFRMLIKNRGFTAVAIIALALGIGANTAIFSAVNAILLKPLPYAEPERLVQVWESRPQQDRSRTVVSPAEFIAWREQAEAFDQIAAVNYVLFNLTGNGEPEQVQGAQVSAAFFPMLGVKPLVGRYFLEEEDRPGKNRAAILSYALWQRRFGGDPGLVNQPVTLNGNSYTVVGIMPRDFGFPQDTVMWTPIAFAPAERDNRGNHYMEIFGRIKSGVTVAEAQSGLARIASQIEEAYPQSNKGHGVLIVSLHDQIVEGLRPALFILLAAVAFVLLIACANIANLLLARAAARQKEMAIRTALGAGRWRIVRQLLAESLLLSSLGGALGLFLAWWGIDALVAFSPTNTPRLNEISLDVRVFAFALVVSLATGILFGLAPAWQASKPNLNETLKEGGRGSTEGRRASLRNILVVSEVALTLVLMVGAGLMLKSFYNLRQVNLGFDPSKLLTMEVTLPAARYPEKPQYASFYDQLLQRIETVLNVRAAAAVDVLPLSGNNSSTTITIEGQPPAPPGERPNANRRIITPNYFNTMGMPVTAGRAFTAGDTADSTLVAIINETMARRFWPGQQALGQRFKIGAPENNNNPWITVVGTVADIKHASVDADARQEYYRPFAQDPWRGMNVVTRTATDPLEMVAALRAQVLSIDADQPVGSVASMEQLVGNSLAPRRLIMMLLGLFAALAVLLASVGVYGVISYSVSRRTHEIGIRMALGAKGTDVLRMVVGQGLALVLTGIALGLVAAYALTSMMSRMLYQVSPTDLTTFAAIAALLTAVALGACAVPARRATKVDPMIALRYE